MYDEESVLENETHKILWDFELQKDHIISARWTDREIVKKKKKKWTCQIVDLNVLVDHRVKIKES